MSSSESLDPSALTRSPTRRSAVYALTLGFAPLLLIFLVAEIALRWTAARGLEEAQHHESQFRPADRGESIGYGSKTTDRPLEILWVGASHVYGVGAPAHLSVTDQMEVLLRERLKRPVHVRKLARIGMGTSGLVEQLKVSLQQRHPQLVFFWAGDANTLDYHGRRKWLSQRTSTRKVVDFLSEKSRLIKFFDLMLRYDEHEYSSSVGTKNIAEILENPFTAKWAWMGNFLPWEPFALEVQPETLKIAIRHLQQGQSEFPNHLGFLVAEANALSQLPGASADELMLKIQQCFEKARYLGRRPLLVEILIEKLLQRDARGLGLRLSAKDRHHLRFLSQQRRRDRVDEQVRPWLQRYLKMELWTEKRRLTESERSALELLVEWIPELPGPAILLSLDTLGRVPQDAGHALRIYERQLMANPFPPLNSHGTYLPQVIRVVAKDNTHEVKAMAERVNAQFPGLFDLLVSDNAELRAWLKFDFAEAQTWIEYYNQRRPFSPPTQMVIVGFQPNRLTKMPTRIHGLLQSVASELELPFLNTYEVIHAAARATNEPVEAYFTQLYGPRDHHLNERGYEALAKASLQLPVLQPYLK